MCGCMHSQHPYTQAVCAHTGSAHAHGQRAHTRQVHTHMASVYAHGDGLPLEMSPGSKRTDTVRGVVLVVEVGST